VSLSGGMETQLQRLESENLTRNRATNPFHKRKSHAGASTYLELEKTELVIIKASISVEKEGHSCCGRYRPRKE